MRRSGRDQAYYYHRWQWCCGSHPSPSDRVDRVADVSVRSAAVYLSAPVIHSIHQAAAAILMCADPDEKCRVVAMSLVDWHEGRLVVVSGSDDPHPVLEPGRPPRPELVAPHRVPKRSLATPEGHAALLHAIAHIEFNAINLALDCVVRYRSLPKDFHGGWMEVAAEEALHFAMVRTRLQELGFDYGDFAAHNGLWEMACKTAPDPLARMALVPRVLEARGLDATLPIMAKLKGIGDIASVAILARILQDEIGHVALGDRWFRTLCARRSLDPETTYFELIAAFNAPRPRPPMHESARLAAGFSVREIERFRGG
jgi:uncharacterized ferritin-like protein (DUF455 family)